jgi:uncharacterized protein
MGDDYASKVSARSVAALVAGGLAVAATAVLTWSVAVEPDRLVVHRIEVPVRGLPRAFDGFRIAALSDVHAGAPYVGREKLRQIVGTVNGLDPDTVVFLGDLVIHGVLGGRFMEPEVSAAELGRMRAPKIAVLGNHDWRLDGRRVGRALEAAGFRVLDNDVTRVERGGDSVWFAGLADLKTRRPNIPGVLARVPPGDAVILLSHNPDVFPSVPTRVGLTLAGHTHGGQVRLPFVGALAVPSRFGRRYVAGLVEEGDRRLFVTTGIGTSYVPVRLGVPPEIAEITLSAAPP